MQAQVEFVRLFVLTLQSHIWVSWDLGIWICDAKFFIASGWSSKIEKPSSSSKKVVDVLF